MELYSENEHYKLFHWNMLDMLEVIGGGTIDSIVTDPPYWLTSIVKRFGKENSAPCKEWKDGSFARLSKWFMGKEWDWSWIEYNIDAWRKCYEVLKPWWYLLAFWGSRTFHRIACAIEDAGFEIRDTIMWLYGSGFPKSLNIWLAIDKKNWVDNRTWNTVEWVGSNNTLSMRNWLTESMEFKSEYEERKATNERAWWGTALKPSYEPIIVARKPLEWSCTDNVIKYGVGGINIDECRVWTETISIHNAPKWTFAGGEYNRGSDTESYRDSVGRFPANTILTYDESDFDEVCGGFPNSWKWNNKWAYNYAGREYDNSETSMFNGDKPQAPSNYNDSWSASRYFYCAKASKRDRDEGLDEMETKSHAEINGRKEWSAGAERAYWWWTNPYLSVSSPRKNTHPTVKPTDLMQYLVRLVTPNGWTVLDPFNWSWSTWKAVMYENKDRHKNYKYIWIELTDEYLPIAKARIEYVINKVEEKPELPYEQPLF